MSKINKPNKVEPVFTHEGARAAHISLEQQLRRSVMSCLLWEKEFYESGEDISKRIKSLAEKLPAEKVAQIAIEARKVANLRHVPLLLLEVITRTGAGKERLVSETIASVISRADEITDFLALYWNGKKKPLSAQVKKGLALALSKFDEYQFAKYNRDGAVKFRDVLRLVHPRPGVTAFSREDRDESAESRNELFRRIVKDELKTPDTWEVALSGGADKRETFERLLREGNLGYLALLRNLRNMEQSKCDHELVSEAIRARKGAKFVLPFRYIAAVRAAPGFAPAINDAFTASLAEMEKFKGSTAILVDVSGSMRNNLSAKSDMNRMDAAAALAAIFPGQKRVFSFSTNLVEIASYGGMGDIENIIRSQPHGNTAMIQATNHVIGMAKFDRIIVITDEQASAYYGAQPLKNPSGVGYVINVASAKNGIGYGKWNHIDGFSENVFRFIREYERQE